MIRQVSPVGADAPKAVTAPRTAPSFNGVRVERVRSGTSGVLFVVPGLAGDHDELSDLVSRFTGPQQVYALSALEKDDDGQPIETIERIAELMAPAIRTIAPHGPYRLAGYSFGGLIALETAHLLRADNAVVGELVLIDAVYDERYWPRGIWLRALARRSGRQAKRIARLPAREAVAETRTRAQRLAKRVVRRSDTSTDTLHEGEGHTATGRAYQAIGRYNPRCYPGRMTLVTSTVDRHFGCDTAEIWKGRADQLEIERIDGDHLSVLQDPRSAASVARVIDHRLALHTDEWGGLRPEPGFERPMILTTMDWFSAARLGHALAESGFSISACHPRSHPLELVDSLTVDARLSRVRPLRSIAAAIRRANPDIILCDDERSLRLLRRLHHRVREADPDIATLITHSIGAVNHWPTIISRAALAADADALGRLAPRTSVIESLSALRSWAADEPFPIVLKTDGSWGGRGVSIVRDRTDMTRAWRRISSPPDVARAVKRAVIDLEVDSLSAWIRRENPVVNGQQFVSGREAIVTLSCIDGKVRSLVCLEVVRVAEARGPATVVRVIDHPEMAETSRQLVCQLGLSGFCGFDFILTDDGRASLVEINPRVTPTCHFLVEGDSLREGGITLFPPLYVDGHWVADAAPDSPNVLDVPGRAPVLAERGVRLAMQHNHTVAQAVRDLKKRVRA